MEKTQPLKFRQNSTFQSHVSDPSSNINSWASPLRGLQTIWVMRITMAKISMICPKMTRLFNRQLVSLVLRVCFSFHRLLKGQHVFRSGTFLKNLSYFLLYQKFLWTTKFQWQQKFQWQLNFKWHLSSSGNKSSNGNKSINGNKSSNGNKWQQKVQIEQKATNWSLAVLASYVIWACSLSYVVLWRGL